jgi:hypothetical protein
LNSPQVRSQRKENTATVMVHLQRPSLLFINSVDTKNQHRSRQ